jgi:hypothetical protein
MWAHASELSEEHQRPGKRVVIQPEFLSKAVLVSSTGNLGMDPEAERWETSEKTLVLQDT